MNQKDSHRKKLEDAYVVVVVVVVVVVDVVVTVVIAFVDFFFVVSFRFERSHHFISLIVILLVDTILNLF